MVFFNSKRTHETDISGVKVKFLSVPTTHSTQNRALKIKESIDKMLTEPQWWEEGFPKKIHLIGHRYVLIFQLFLSGNLQVESMGGIDGRFFISKLEGHKHVATLTTIATPHRGSRLGIPWRFP